MLEKNYPIPFNPSAHIDYQRPASAFVVLKVFDVFGREVETLMNKYQNAGNSSVQFNGSNLPKGVYFSRLDPGTYHDA